MEEKAANPALISRHTEGLPHIWPVMESYGVTVEQCLKGTGLSIEQAWGRAGGMTLEQEFSLYRNLLQRSGDAMLGLKLGALFHPQVYGIFGYALMSARNLSTIIDISYRFFDLTYSHFHPVSLQQGKLWASRYELRYPLPEDLLQVYSDRDMEAGYTLLNSVGLDRSVISELHLCYRDDENLHHYEKHFGCPVNMGQAFNAFLYPPSLMSRELPWQNERATDACVKACQELLEEICGEGSLRSRVVDQLIDKPGEFSSIEQIAEALNLSTRSLRRKLQQEGTSYQDLLKEVRLNLARQYLKERFSVEQIAELLGYSETSAFSRAFKSWTGRPPQDFRVARAQ